MQDSVQFNAPLKLPQVIALYIGAVLGSGILIIPGVAAEVSGPASLLAWGIMIILMLPMALTMGLLSARYPNVGGVSFFVAKAFNSRVGSLIGWWFLMSVVVGAPVLALTGAGYLCAAIGLGDSSRLMIAGAISLVLSAIIFIFIRWTILYPIIITFIWVCYMFISKKPLAISEFFKCEEN